MKYREWGVRSAPRCVMDANEARELLMHGERVWETDRRFLPVLILIRSALVLAVDLYLDLTEVGRPAANTLQLR